jgi:alpha-beta hydrolase superfamily lysophospholipase
MASVRPTSAGEASARFSDGLFEGAGALRLYHCEFAPERPGETQAGALVALMHGYGEHCRRYDEVSRYLAGRGHVVCSMDARGHGRSQGQRGYVREYADYVADFTAFVARVRARHAGRKLVVFGHSNGGLIAVRAIQTGLLGASGLLLTSPLIELASQQKKLPDALASALSALVPRLPVPSGIRVEDLTHDRELCDAYRRDGWRHGMATPRWYWSTTLAARAALAEAASVTLPLLIVQAEQDRLVNVARVAEFHARARAADKQLIVREGEYHEVLNEVARLELYGLVGDWIERVAAD